MHGNNLQIYYILKEIQYSKKIQIWPLELNDELHKKLLIHTFGVMNL